MYGLLPWAKDFSAFLQMEASSNGKTRWCRQQPEKNSIPNDYLIKLSISKDGKRVFVATSVGLACYDQHKNSWTSTFGGVNCLNKGSFSHCVYSDSKNRVWFGTEDGAICYDPKKGYTHPKIYNTELGLSDNSVASIIEDYKGRIWIGTTCGLNQVDTEKELSTSTSRTMAYRAMSSAMQLPARSGEERCW